MSVVCDMDDMDLPICSVDAKEDRQIAHDMIKAVHERKVSCRDNDRQRPARRPPRC
jgi:hypothetical protein